MKLLPSLKQKKRYLVFEISETLPESALKEEVSLALYEFVGTLGVSKMSPLFVKHKNNRFIIKVNHKYVDECKSALILIKKIKNKPVIVKSIITSGTLKKASLSL